MSEVTRVRSLVATRWGEACPGLESGPPFGDEASLGRAGLVLGAFFLALEG